VLVECLVPFEPATGGRPPAGAVAELVVRAHVITAAGGIERQVLRLPVVADPATAGTAEPTITREAVLLDAARARQTALRARERGDYAAGAAALHAAAGTLCAMPRPPGAAPLADEAADLTAMAAAFEAGEVSAADAKYLGRWPTRRSGRRSAARGGCGGGDRE
jgi:hypothetical protein